jgi:hypothetical protein
MTDPLWFSPGVRNTQLIVTSTGSVTTRIGDDPDNTPPRFVRLYNGGSDRIYVEIGATTVFARIPSTTVPGSFPIPAGVTVVVPLNGQKYLAHAASTTAMVLFVTPQGA